MVTTHRRSSGPIIRFLGAARTVTGSKFLVRHQRASLLVDCGLFQGRRELRARNWDAPPVDPAELDAVVLTHAHLDHCGYLPRLVRDGFRGRVYATPATTELAQIVLPDSGHLQEEEASFAARKSYSRHDPPLPLYTEAEAREALTHLEPLPFSTDAEVAPGMTVRFEPAGHILGSAIVQLRLAAGPVLCFSGDLGRPDHPLLIAPTRLGTLAAAGFDADFVVVESTYGDRMHQPEVLDLTLLADVIERTVARGGSVVIPAFAVDRTEMLLHHLASLEREGRVPPVPVFVDSPMALASLAAYRRAGEREDPDVRPDAGLHHGFGSRHLTEVQDLEGSKRLNRPRQPCVIISAAGMVSGGRVVHHLAHQLPDRRNSVILVGYQVEGTKGHQLASGARQIKLAGQYVPVRAEVHQLDSFSAHADADELLGWLHSATRAPRNTFVVHGEEAAGLALAERIDDELGWLAVVPTHNEIVRLQ